MPSVRRAIRSLVRYESGPDDLFLLNSVLLGWASAAAAERRIDATGTGLVMIAVPFCLAAIAGGFGLAAILLAPLPGVSGELLIFCAICTVGAAIVRANLGDFL
jgi:hypothetical protein